MGVEVSYRRAICNNNHNRKLISHISDHLFTFITGIEGLMIKKSGRIFLILPWVVQTLVETSYDLPCGVFDVDDLHPRVDWLSRLKSWLC